MIRCAAIAFLLPLLLLFSACAPPVGNEQPQPTPVPAATVPVEPQPTPAAGDQGRAVSEQLAAELGSQLGAEVKVVSVEPAEWPDGCLGLPAADEVCAEAVTPGYLVILEVPNDHSAAGRYQYRSDTDGAETRLESSPASPVLVWQREGGLAGFCDEVRIDAGDSVTISSCGEVTGERALTAEESATLAGWLQRFAPFEMSFTDPAAADALTVGLLFRGRGAEEAGVEIEEAMAVFAAGLLSPVAQPTAAAGAISEADQTAIYAAVVRQVYTKDHTFGEAPEFPVVYLLAAASIGPGGAVEQGAPVLAPEVQQGVIAALSDLPAKWIWVASFDETPRDPEVGRVADGGALITVGPIAVQGPGKVHVDGSVYVAPLVAGGQTYVVENTARGWEITGATGAAWMS